MTKPTRLFWIQALFFGAIIVFFGFYLRGIDYQSLKNLEINWMVIALASALALGFRYWGVMIWRFILKDLGAEALPAFRVLSSIYAKAWMARYIPGTVTWIVGKVYLAGRMGISRKRLAVASILEGGMQIISVSALSILLLGFDPRLNVIPNGLKISIVFFGFGLLLLLSPLVFNWIIRSAYRLVSHREADEELRTNKRAIARTIILYSIGAFISGTSYFFFAGAIWPEVSAKMYFYLVGAFNLAGAIGMAALFVPSGLGVREGVQLVLLSAVLPKEVALVITIASRLWSACVDVLFYFIAAGLARPKTDRSLLINDNRN